MADRQLSWLSVSIRDLQPFHVAYMECKFDARNEESSAQIRDCFRAVAGWVAGLGYDTEILLRIGVPIMTRGRLSGYECCVQVPQAVQGGSGGIAVKDLAGGRFAVVSMEKDPATIGELIDRFYQEYVPANKLELDGARPTYEVYYMDVMEYCVPIRGGEEHGHATEP